MKKRILLLLCLLLAVGIVTGSVFATDQNVADYKENIGKLAHFNSYWIEVGSYFTVAADPAKVESIWNQEYQVYFNELADPAIALKITDVYVDSNKNQLWYQVAMADGSALPAVFGDWTWIYQNQLFNSYDPDALVLSEMPSISATVDGQTVTVSGVDLPKGATLDVKIPEINGEKLPNVFDIKVLKADGTEWQPIDEDKTVTITIPVSDPNVKYVDVYHYIDNKDAIHEGVEYWPTDNAGEEILDILVPAITASGKKGYIAVEKFERLSVVNSVAGFEVNSFSIFEFNTQYELIRSNKSDDITFDNDLDTSKLPTYYATAGTEFTLETGSLVTRDPYTNGKYFNVESGSDYIIMEDEVGDKWGYVEVDIRIAGEAPVGASMTIRFKTKTIINTVGKDIPVTIIVVAPISIKYDENLPEGVTASNMPEDRIKYSDNDDRRVYTDANEAKFIIPTDKIPTAANQSDTGDTYTFKGWSTSPLGDVGFYAWDGKNFDPINFTPTQDITLYAIWERGKCSVTFDDNNGTEHKQTYTVTYGDKVAAPQQPSRDGYIFLGWCASMDGSSTRYFPATDGKPADEIMVKSDVVMYALWGVKLDIIAIGGKLSIQKGEGEFVEIKQQNEYGFEVKSAGNDVTTYYIVVPEHAYANIYFRFTPTTEGNTIKIEHYGSDMEYLKIIDSDKLSGDVRISTAGLTTETKITFTALDKYVVTFVTNGGSPLSSVAVDKGNSLNLNNYKTTQAGYGSYEWYLTPDFSGQPVTNLTNITKNITVYAKWAVNTYTVTYKDGDSATTALYTIKDILDLARSKPGYTFKGWAVTTADGNWTLDRTYTGAVTGMYGNVTLTAQWEVNKNDVVYDGNDPSTPDMNDVAFGTKVMVETPTDREGYTFVHWAVEGITDITKLYAGDIFTMPDNKVTLKAVWEAKEYTITWNDGFGNSSVETYKFGDSITNPTNPEKWGYAFAGWGDIPATMPAENLEFTAQWTTSFSVAIDNGGTISADWLIIEDGSAYKDGIPLGFCAGMSVTFKPAEGYRIAGVKITMGEDSLDPGVFTDDEYIFTIPQGGITGPLNIKVTTALKSTTLKVQVNGCNMTLDPEQSYLFTLKSIATSEDIDLDFAICEEGYVKIGGLMIGNSYTITLKDNWSWRYDVEEATAAKANVTVNDVSITFTLEADETVTFTMNRTNDQWLDGNDYHVGN